MLLRSSAARSVTYCSIAMAFLMMADCVEIDGGGEDSS